MEVVVSWGKDVGTKIKESIPEGTKILRQQDNFDRAALEVLLYSDDFEEISNGCEIPRINLDLKLNDAKKAPSLIIARH
jgi:hypothetical protein